MGSHPTWVTTDKRVGARMIMAGVVYINIPTINMIMNIMNITT